MNRALIEGAVALAKNPRVQRVVIGAVIGGLVGYAIAKTAEPYIFPAEEEFEMIPPYETEPNANTPIMFNNSGEPVGEVTSVIRDGDHVSMTGKIYPAKYLDSAMTKKDEFPSTPKPAPRPKYAKPVAVQTAAKEEPVNKPEAKPVKVEEPAPVPNKAAVSTFSTREPSGMTGGGNPNKKMKE